MEASPVKLIQYFDGMKQNVIPLFQRPYCWEKKHWEVLWDDVKDIYISNNEKPHFLGAIVSTPIKTVPVGVNKHLIIDGQQRLFTTAILLCSIRSFVEERTKGLINDYLINRHYEKEDHLKFYPTIKDYSDYQSLITNSENSCGNSQIIKCYDYFRKQIQLAINEFDFNPEIILQIIVNSFEVVMINLKDTDDPYLIFESLNHKGEPLKQGDLIRNYLLMKYKHSVDKNGEQAKIYDELWRPMEVDLGDSIDGFFYHYSRRNGIDVRKNSVYSAYREAYSSIPLVDDITKEIKKMKIMASFYHRFEFPDSEPDPKLKELYGNFKTLKKTVIYPFLMKLFEKIELKKIDNNEVITCLNILESYVVRREICKASSNFLKNSFLDLCKNLPIDNFSEWISTKLANNSGNLRWPEDEEVRENLISKDFYTPNFSAFVLQKIERSYGHKEKVDFSNLTVEHILPQTLTDDWKKMLGNNYVDGQNLPPNILHNIGNLTLTGFNSNLSNFSFDKKKQILRDSHIDLNRWISEQEIWSEKEICLRAEMLSNQIIDIWKRPE